MIGTVKWFNPTKGYGFIAAEDGSGDMFVHVTEVSAAGLGSSLTEGQKLMYDTEINRRTGRPCAINLVEL